MSAPLPDVSAALLLGLFGSVHCLGMCGGISAALALGQPQDRPPLQRYCTVLLYNLGRIASYALFGALVGLLSGWLVEEFQPAMTGLRLVAGLLLVLMGLYLAGISKLLLHVERAAAAWWRPVQQRAAGLFRLPGPGGALVAGMIWGWLPCGLVYSTLAWSATSGSGARSALLMAAFGLGTMPAVLGSGLAASQVAGWLNRRGLRQLVGLLVIGFGLWTAVMPLTHGGHAEHASPETGQQHHHPG